ncbi:MAG: hypothetical protein U0359_06030 [Byssovorax sp.]
METPETVPTRLVARMPAAESPSAVLEVPLSNPTDKRLRLRRRSPIKVELSSGTTRVTTRAEARGVLGPNETGSASVDIEVPPLAPPGEYTGTLEVAGQAHPIRLIIPLRQRVDVMPGRVVLAGDDERPVIALSITNHGNTPVTVVEPAPVRLEPQDRTCFALRRALEIAAAPDASRPMLEALVRAAAESAAADPILVGMLADGPVSLAPGETKLVHLTLRVPSTERGSYRGTLALAGHPFDVEIYSTGHKRGAP